MSAPDYTNLNSNVQSYSATQNGGAPGTAAAYQNGTGGLALMLTLLR